MSAPSSFYNQTGSVYTITNPDLVDTPGTVTGNQEAKTSFYENNSGSYEQPALLSGEASIEFVLSNAGAALITGLAGYLQVPFGCQLIGWTLLGNAVGSIDIDIWKTTYALFNPPTHPVAADTITGGAGVALVSEAANTSTTFPGWSTTTFSAGDVIAIDVKSVDGVLSKVTLSLLVKKT